MGDALTFLDFVLVAASCRWYDKNLGFSPSCAAVRGQASSVLYFSHSSLALFNFQQTSNVSATLVLSRPIKGPREVVLDLEMVTVNNVINFRGSSIIRLTIFVSEHPFWGSRMNFIKTIKLLSSAADVMVRLRQLTFYCFFLLFFLNHYVILNKDTSDKDSAKISWWESIPVLQSPTWFNGHWAIMAAIWTLDIEGYLWCTISDILY